MDHRGKLPSLLRSVLSLLETKGPRSFLALCYSMYSSVGAVVPVVRPRSGSLVVQVVF